jgi:hypothetical protein
METPSGPCRTASKLSESVRQHLNGFAIAAILAGVGLLALFTVLALFCAVAMAQNPLPLVNQPLVPAAVAPGGSGFTLTVNGTGFVSGATVNWNGSARTTTFVSSSQLTASITASDIATATTASVTVVNSSPGGVASNVVFFPVRVAAGTVALGESGIFPFYAGESFRTQTVGDFNQDRKLDLAISSTGGLDILLGNGDGTFQPAVSYAVPDGAGFATVGDFNRDGKLDLAVLAGTAAAPIVSILLGNGDGTFQSHIDTPIDVSIPNPYWIATGDLNGDGELDLVVGYQGGSAVSVLLGNSDGTFQPFVDYATAAEPTAVVVGDFNGDGKLDIATANFGGLSGNTVSILLGNGDGTFQPHVEYLADGGPLSLVAADFNGDGKLDLAVDCSCGHSSPCGRPGTVAILLGNGDGTFKAPVIYDVDQFPFTIASGDFNGDGKIDLAVTDFDSNKISFLLGNGDGTFQPHFEVTLVYAGPVGLETGDFNGDGLLDLVINNTTPFGSHIVDLMLQPDFAVSSNPTSATVTAGSLASYTLSVAPQGGFNQAVSLSCTGAPTLATCTITPTSVTLDGTNTQTVTVKVTTTAPTPAASTFQFQPPAWGGPHAAPSLFWLVAFATVAGLLVGGRRRVRLGFATVAFLVLLLAACGGSGTSSGKPGTPPGTYSLTVTATSGSLSHNVTLKLTVN